MLRARPDVHEQVLIPILAAFQDVCVSEDDADYLERATLLVRVIVATHTDELQGQRIQVWRWWLFCLSLKVWQVQKPTFPVYLLMFRCE